MPVEEVVELRCGAIAAGGGCVARGEDGRVVFVRHSLPGELVRARITSTSTSFCRADAVEVLEPSRDRVEPPCPYAGPGRCGGCDFQHASLDAQRRLKADLVADQLRRLAGVEREILVEAVPGDRDGLGWRTRVRFAVGADGRVGFRRHRSHDLEPVDGCLVASDAVEAVGVESVRWPGATAVEVFATEPVERRRAGRGDGAPIGVVGVAPGPGRPLRRDLARLAPAGAGVVVGGELVRPPGRLRADAGGHSFQISAGAFWQVHRGAPEVLVAAVLDGLAPRPGDRILDCYAGVGLFAVALGAAVGPLGAVTAVERDARAAADARRNAADLPQVEVVEAPVSARVLARNAGVDLVVLDPPRGGAGRAVVDALVALRPAPRRVAYVACDPASFARDLATALAARWRLAELRAFDQFPMTEHVELVAILEPEARGR